MNKEIYNGTLGINETDVRKEENIAILIEWKFAIKKDILNINEKYDQNSNENLLRDNQDPKEAAIAAHKALYAMKRQQLLLELVIDRIEQLKEAMDV